MTEREFGRLKRFFGLIWRLQGRGQVYLEIKPTEERTQRSPGGPEHARSTRR